MLCCLNVQVLQNSLLLLGRRYFHDCFLYSRPRGIKKKTQKEQRSSPFPLVIICSLLLWILSIFVTLYLQFMELCFFFFILFSKYFQNNFQYFSVFQLWNHFVQCIFLDYDFFTPWKQMLSNVYKCKKIWVISSVVIH